MLFGAENTDPEGLIPRQLTKQLGVEDAEGQLSPPSLYTVQPKISD